MIKIISILLVLISILFSSSTSWAGMLVKEYKELKEIASIQAFIIGVGSGLMWANTFMQKETEKRLFCEPENHASQKPNFIRILDDEIERSQKSTGVEKVQELPIELLLFDGLKFTFSCK